LTPFWFNRQGEFSTYQPLALDQIAKLAKRVHRARNKPVSARYISRLRSGAG
jgi:hypothetical protein